MKKFKKNFETKVVELYLSGVSSTKIGKMFKKHNTSILRILKRYNIVIRNKCISKRKNFSENEINFILDSYKNGKNTVVIADKLNTYNTSVRRILLKNNVDLVSTGDRQRFVKNNPFLNNEVSDYFLGLLITDGCISNKNRITLGLKFEDVYMLDNFAKFLSNRNTHKVKTNKYFHKAHNKYQYQVSFKSDIVSSYLNEQANFKNKSYDLFLKRKLNWNILRGIIDGDGSFILSNDKKRLSISIFSVSEVFIDQIINFLKENNFNPTKTESKRSENLHTLYQVNIHKIKEVLKIGNFLYSDATIFLKRKNNKWLDLLEIRGNKIP